jgi:hypothetical protein
MVKESGRIFGKNLQEAFGRLAHYYVITKAEPTMSVMQLKYFRFRVIVNNKEQKE